MNTPRNPFTRRLHTAAAALAVALMLPLASLPASAQSAPAAAAPSAHAAALKEIEGAFGQVPVFIKQYPPAALAGAWAQYKGLHGPDAAIPPKYKSLISLAVAAQIPCAYCIAMDTQSARKAGATDKEINEAIAVAAMTRHWSAVFYGMQVDLAQFKRDFGGDK
jgi:AhpD family alkylhydroperoxidase